jgi:hypothetical protein
MQFPSLQHFPFFFQSCIRRSAGFPHPFSTKRFALKQQEKLPQCFTHRGSFSSSFDE